MPAGFKAGGRQAGTPNKNTAEIKALAQQYGPAAIAKLAEIAGLILDPKGKPIGQAPKDETRVAALDKLLDRGYGKARQPLSGPDADDASATPVQIVYRWASSGDSQSE